jgi:hypothetical protein
MWSRREELIKYYVVKKSGAHNIVHMWSRRVELIQYYFVKKRGARKILCGRQKKGAHKMWSRRVVLKK